MTAGRKALAERGQLRPGDWTLLPVFSEELGRNIVSQTYVD